MAEDMAINSSQKIDTKDYSASVQANSVTSLDSGSNLFDEISTENDSTAISTTTREDTVSLSTHSTDETKTAEMQSLESEYGIKQTEIDSINDEITANLEERKAAYSALSACNTAVADASDAYDSAAAAYSAAAETLAELQGDNLFSKAINSILNKSKIENAQTQVNKLKAEAEQAYEEYEEAVKEQAEAKDTVTELNDKYSELREQRINANDEAASLKKQINELRAAEQEAAAEAEAQEAQETQETEAEETKGPGKQINTAGQPALEDDAVSNPELNSALAGIDTEGLSQEEIDALIAQYGDTGSILDEEPSYFQDILNQADTLQAEFEHTPAINDFEPDQVDKLCEAFLGEFSKDEILQMGTNLLEIVDEAGKALETKLVANTYAKSSGMATADSASTQEHSEAESGFIDAVLQVSDIVNNSDVEFGNIADKSNYELASNMLDRITDGEYIKTDTLEKQTSVVQNITVEDKIDESTSDNRYEEFSDAILNELQRLASDDTNEFEQEDFESIKTQFDMKAAEDIENAFDYLEDAARKYGINEAVSDD